LQFSCPSSSDAEEMAQDELESGEYVIDVSRGWSSTDAAVAV